MQVRGNRFMYFICTRKFVVIVSFVVTGYSMETCGDGLTVGVERSSICVYKDGFLGWCLDMLYICDVDTEIVQMCSEASVVYVCGRSNGSSIL